MNLSTSCGKILACLLLLTASSAIAQTSGQASFVGTDSSTLGNWASKYGFDGYVLPTAQSPLMNISSFSHPNSYNWVWAASTTDVRALQAPGGGNEPAATWYNNPSFYLDITTEGIEQIAVYAVDWDNRGRSETLQVVDGDTNAQLDVRPISNFTNGVYLVWTISGHVKINVTATAGPNAVIGGIFFGGGIGATIHVPADQSTIQAAINAASNGDIVLVAPGTYHENINFLGKAIIVTSSGGADVTSIDGGQLGPEVTFATNEGHDSILSGFTIRNGLASSANYNLGGGIYISSAYPTITANSIVDNRGCSGVGIGSLSGGAFMQGNLIEHNSASATCANGYGIGIDIEGTGFNGSGQILGNTITGNSTSAGQGGGIAVYGAYPLIKGNLISYNSVSGFSPASEGGGILVSFVTHNEIVNNVIVGNTADSGGGIAVDNADDAYSTPVILNNTSFSTIARQSTCSGMLLNVGSRIMSRSATTSW